MSEGKQFRVNRESRTGYCFVLPAVLFMAAMIIYPLIYNFNLSFRDMDVMSFKNNSAKYVGLSNFVYLFTSDSVFLDALKHTFQFTSRSLVSQFSIGFALALFFNKKFRLSGMVRGSLIMGYMMPMSVTGLLFKNLFATSTSEGVINAALAALGFIHSSQPIGWLVSEKYALWAVTLANCWVGIPFNMMLLVAGLSSIDQTTYEAATIDGANSLQCFCNITMPLMKSSIVSVLMLGFIYTFKVFDLVYIMTNGGPVNATQVLSSYSYKLSFSQYNFSLGAAVAVVLFVCLMCVGFAYLFLVRKEEVE